ncbi:MAG: FkbM family methyltransferase [Theionarchaea archaeon]|nr:MAG: hypothetical protein AYK19_10305 [Theionarchaea archaeon DG-70-1]MBU7029761.1 FkbM family methyltransferase [Theionarchaea archaeon]
MNDDKKPSDTLSQRNRCQSRSLALVDMDTSEFVLHVEDMCISFVTDDPWSRQWFYSRLGGGRLHEEPVTRLLVHNLEQCMCFFDVGACLGYYTMIASKAVGIRGVVHAFELDKFNCSIIKKNLERNQCRNVKVHHIAVSDTLGTVEYIRGTDSRGTYSLNSGLKTLEDKTFMTVDSTSLDEFCATMNIIPDVIKIDVEGAELKVLNGMKKLLYTRDIKLFCEVHPEKLASFGHTEEQVIDKLHAFGMRVFEIAEFSRTHSKSIKLRLLERGTAIGTRSMLYAYRDKHSPQTILTDTWEVFL